MMARSLYGIAALLAAPLAASANSESFSGHPTAAWFGGVGGAYVHTDLKQSMLGVSNPTSVFQDGTLVAVGTAGGPAVPFGLSDDTFAPVGQLGYFEQFPGSSMLWGVKFTYLYSGADMQRREILPQAGEFTTVGGSTDTFTGNVLIGSSGTRAAHQLSLFTFFGQRFSSGFIYAGGGPVIMEVETEIRNAIGFADINGQHSDITGAPMNFSNREWVWGGGFQLGLTYFLSENWFLDLNYTWARTVQSSTTFSAQFSSSYVDDGATITTEGSANLVVGNRLTTQSVGLSLNRAF